MDMPPPAIPKKKAKMKKSLWRVIKYKITEIVEKSHK